MSQPESLVRRLAGPSTGKAGVKQDQAEINRIIAETSKGSKFYENEKRKDQELTERINGVLQLRDELLKMASMPGLEAAAEKVIEDLESERDLSQIIVHVDLDSFFAAVEVLYNPDLAGKAFGVGSISGVLSTASYEARKFGVRSAMPGYIAKKLCPELIFVRSHYDRYSELSHQVMDILKEYDSTMAVGGMDEAFLNLTQYCEVHEMDAQECVSMIRERIHQETKLTISAGIAVNKMLAKICSDKNKPNGQFYLPPEREAILNFMRDLSIRKIPGIGRIAERLLESIGIKTCGDVYRMRGTLALLDKQFHLRSLLRDYLGIASNVVRPGQRESRKSVGVETTFHALSDSTKILEKLQSVASDLEEDLARTGWAGQTITLKYKLDTYQGDLPFRTLVDELELSRKLVFTRAKSFGRLITKKEDLFTIGKELLMAEMPLKLRLIGLRATKLKDLRADHEKGIKRFFKEKDDNSSPRKKVKLAPEFVNLVDSDEEEGAEDHGDDDGFREVDMPMDEDEIEEKLVATFVGREPINLNDGVASDPDPGLDKIRSQVTEPSRASVPPRAKSRTPLPMVPDRWGIRCVDLSRNQATQAHSGDQRGKSAPPTHSHPDNHSNRPKQKQKQGREVGDPIAPPPLPSFKPKRTGKQLTLSRTAFQRPRRPSPPLPPSPPPPGGEAKKPVSASKESESPRKPKTEKNTCPLCFKMIAGDNAALNGHIDWCLSREVIKEASAG